MKKINKSFLYKFSSLCIALGGIIFYHGPCLITNHLFAICSFFSKSQSTVRNNHPHPFVHSEQLNHPYFYEPVS